MHLDLPHLIYSGPPVDDPKVLGEMPSDLRAALAARNGCVAYRGALHIRGATLAPDWHSLRSALLGPQAYNRLYPEVSPTDIPFAEDLFGDQFILRGGVVFRLTGESGDFTSLDLTLDEFLSESIQDISTILGYDPTQVLAHVNNQLQPGYQIQVYPPFVLDTPSHQRSFRPIPSTELRLFLADFASQIRNLPEGARIECKVKD